MELNLQNKKSGFCGQEKEPSSSAFHPPARMCFSWIQASTARIHPWKPWVALTSSLRFSTAGFSCQELSFSILDFITQFKFLPFLFSDILQLPTNGAKEFGNVAEREFWASLKSCRVVIKSLLTEPWLLSGLFTERSERTAWMKGPRLTATERQRAGRGRLYSPVEHPEVLERQRTGFTAVHRKHACHLEANGY